MAIYVIVMYGLRLFIAVLQELQCLLYIRMIRVRENIIVMERAIFYRYLRICTLFQLLYMYNNYTQFKLCVQNFNRRLHICLCLFGEKEEIS